MFEGVKRKAPKIVGWTTGTISFLLTRRFLVSGLIGVLASKAVKEEQEAKT